MLRTSMSTTDPLSRNLPPCLSDDHFRCTFVKLHPEVPVVQHCSDSIRGGALSSLLCDTVTDSKSGWSIVL